MNIYDQTVQLHAITGDSALNRRISAEGVGYYCRERTVGLQRFFTALQVGDRIDAVLEIPGRELISPAGSVAVWCGQQYRLTQVQHALDDDGLDVTVLSLSRLEADYELDTR